MEHLDTNIRIILYVYPIWFILRWINWDRSIIWTQTQYNRPSICRKLYAQGKYLGFVFSIKFLDIIACRYLINIVCYGYKQEKFRNNSQMDSHTTRSQYVGERKICGISCYKYLNIQIIKVGDLSSMQMPWVCVVGRISPPLGWVHAMVGWEAG